MGLPRKRAPLSSSQEADFQLSSPFFPYPRSWVPRPLLGILGLGAPRLLFSLYLGNEGGFGACKSWGKRDNSAQIRGERMEPREGASSTRVRYSLLNPRKGDPSPTRDALRRVWTEAEWSPCHKKGNKEWAEFLWSRLGVQGSAAPCS